MTTFLTVVFLLSVVIIWMMIGYQFVLTVAGYLHYRRSSAEKIALLSDESGLPNVTILIPAHNEESVIEDTLERLTALDYPSERLKILVINDASTDSTGEIADRLAAADPRIEVLHRVPPEGGRGKSAALNAGWRTVSSEVIAVYDADNQPEPHALKLLVRKLMKDEKCGAVLGKFRTGNRSRNLLTRFINIEGLSFQWIVQAGRSRLLGVSTIPGTNFVIRRSVLEELGGWDTEALTEDSELSVRIYEHGYRIDFAPYAVTWEQEPETLRVWLKQRTRWARGNNYVLGKFLKSFRSFNSRVMALEMLYSLALYYLFLAALLISDAIFFLGIFRLAFIPICGPYTQVWLVGIVLYLVEIRLAMSFEGEDTAGNFLLSLVMYFTYCQLWIVVVLRAFYADFIKRERRVWDKTVRFAGTIESTDT